MNLTILKRYETYTRKEAHDIFSPETNFSPQTGTWGLHGIIEINNSKSYVFFVTIGASQGDHIFDENIDDHGILTWQSQPSNKLTSQRIINLINHDEKKNNIFLFLRPNKNNKSYVYLGKLAYLTHDNQRECPVYFKWSIIDYDHIKTSALLNGVNISYVGCSGLAVSGKAEEPTQKRQGISDKDFQRANIDFAKQALSNIDIGNAGEEAVFEYEKQILIKAGKSDLAKKVCMTRDSIGNTAPYDILSFTEEGQVKYIEVKTTEGPYETPFYLSKNEKEFSDKHNEIYYLYRVYNFQRVSREGEIYIHRGKIADSFDLEGKNYICRVKK